MNAAFCRTRMYHRVSIRARQREFSGRPSATRSRPVPSRIALLSAASRTNLMTNERRVGERIWPDPPDSTGRSGDPCQAGRVGLPDVGVMSYSLTGDALARRRTLQRSGSATSVHEVVPVVISMSSRASGLRARCSGHLKARADGQRLPDDGRDRACSARREAFNAVVPAPALGHRHGPRNSGEPHTAHVALQA